MEWWQPLLEYGVLGVVNVAFGASLIHLFRQTQHLQEERARDLKQYSVDALEREQSIHRTVARLADILDRTQATQCPIKLARMLGKRDRLSSESSLLED